MNCALIVWSGTIYPKVRLSQHQRGSSSALSQHLSQNWSTQQLHQHDFVSECIYNRQLTKQFSTQCAFKRNFEEQFSAPLLIFPPKVEAVTALSESNCFVLWTHIGCHLVPSQQVTGTLALSALGPRCETAEVHTVRVHLPSKSLDHSLYLFTAASPM